MISIYMYKLSIKTTSCRDHDKHKPHSNECGFYVLHKCQKHSFCIRMVNIKSKMAKAMVLYFQQRTHSGYVILSLSQVKSQKQ